MKIEDLKVGRVYRAKRPRGVHRLDGSYVNDREILYISPFGESIQYDSPSVTFKAKYPIISTEKFLMDFLNSNLRKILYKAIQPIIKMEL